MKKDIVLCATQRCGSTMVVEDMRNSNQLGLPGEWFIPWKHSEKRDWDQARAAVRKKSQGPNGVRAVKVMADQMAIVDQCLRPQHSASNVDTSFSKFRGLFEDAVWVHIKREDIVAQAVSRLMAKQTGINHATDADEHFAGKIVKGSGRQTYNEKTEYKFEAIQRECTSITLENLTWSRFFKANKIKPIQLVYENYSVDPDMQHLNILAEAVGCKDIQKREREIVKIGNQKNKDFINRFYEDFAQRRYSRK